MATALRNLGMTPQTLLKGMDTGPQLRSVATAHNEATMPMTIWTNERANGAF